MRTILFAAFALLAAVSLLYASFLWNPILFDDSYFFLDSAGVRAFGHSFTPLELRWLPYATLSWTVNIFGFDLIWLRLGNLLLHAANGILIFLLFRALISRIELREGGLSATWLSLFGALLFCWHPVAVYCAAYLVQRSTLMSTLFVLLMLLMYWRGVESGRMRWLAAAGVCYFLALFSKQHSLMAPLAALALTPLIRPLSWSLFRGLIPFFIGCGAIGGLMILKSWGLLGSAYEPGAQDFLQRMAESQSGREVTHAYGLSVLTQVTLFFKYWALWLMPNPAWMSVDMRDPFAESLLDGPRLAGLAAFVGYAVLAVWLLLQRGGRAVLGFAMLFPWVMFMTELSVVRIQEPFVLYRSYLWMSVGILVVPLMFMKMQAKPAALSLVLICLAMLPLSWDRLTTFSHPLLLWDDAAKLIEGAQPRPGMERIYHNRATALSRTPLKEEALADYTMAIQLKPDYSFAYNDRGAVYFELKRYAEAMKDFETAIALNPNYANAYQGRAMVYEVWGAKELALQNYRVSCQLGRRGCEKVGGR